jgi:hypothetical protein
MNLKETLNESQELVLKVTFEWCLSVPETKAWVYIWNPDIDRRSPATKFTLEGSFENFEAKLYEIGTQNCWEDEDSNERNFYIAGNTCKDNILEVQSDKIVIGKTNSGREWKSTPGTLLTGSHRALLKAYVSVEKLAPGYDEEVVDINWKCQVDGTSSQWGKLTLCSDLNQQFSLSRGMAIGDKELVGRTGVNLYAYGLDVDAEVLVG